VRSVSRANSQSAPSSPFVGEVDDLVPPGGIAVLAPQTHRDIWHAELVGERRFVHTLPEHVGHGVENTGPRLLVVGGVGTHRRLVVEPRTYAPCGCEHDGVLVARAVPHGRQLLVKRPSRVVETVPVLAVRAQHDVQRGQRAAQEAQVRVGLGLAVIA